MFPLGNRERKKNQPTPSGQRPARRGSQRHVLACCCPPLGSGVRSSWEIRATAWKANSWLNASAQDFATGVWSARGFQNRPSAFRPSATGARTGRRREGGRVRPMVSPSPSSD